VPSLFDPALVLVHTFKHQICVGTAKNTACLLQFIISFMRHKKQEDHQDFLSKIPVASAAFRLKEWHGPSAVSTKYITALIKMYDLREKG
jgi:hypothetical protein